MNKEKFVNRFKTLLNEYAFIDNNELNQTTDYLDEDMVYEDGEEDDEISFDDFENGSEDIDDSLTNDDSMDSEMGDMGAEPQQEPAVEPKPELDNQTDSGDIEQDGDEIELDVTELVTKTDDAARKADATNAKLDDLLSQIDQVLQTSVKIDQLSSHIDSLESEIIKRNPSKVEKLELQSLHSAPYNVKLGDYWDDKLGDYATDISTDRPTFNDLEKDDCVTNPSGCMPNGSIGATPTNKPQEIVVTKDDVNNGYNENDIKNSFDYYEEDEIDEY